MWAGKERFRRVLLAGFMAILMGFGFQMVGGSAASASGPGYAGVASHMFWMSESDVRAGMTTLATNGISWAREDFRWDVLEPSRGSFNWSHSDALMAGAAAAGVNVLAILDYSAPWASSDPSGAGSIYYPPTQNSDYADFARAVAARYGAGGTFWASRPDLTARPLGAVELWNEPWGYWFWKSGPNPSAYAALAHAAASAVKSVQPSLPVLLSGDLLQVRADGALVSWLDNVLKADPGLASVVDAYSIHPYPYPRNQGPLVDHADRRWDYSRVTLIHDVAVNDGADKPLWITEVGWSTAQTSDSVSEADQATFVHDAMVRAATQWPYVQRFFVYSSDKDGTNSTDREQHYGFQRNDGSYKPSWNALKNAITEIGASSSSTSTTAVPTTSTTVAPTKSTTTSTNRTRTRKTSIATASRTTTHRWLRTLRRHR